MDTGIIDQIEEEIMEVIKSFQKHEKVEVSELYSLLFNSTPSNYHKVLSSF